MKGRCRAGFSVSPFTTRYCLLCIFRLWVPVARKRARAGDPNLRAHSRFPHHVRVAPKLETLSGLQSKAAGPSNESRAAAFLFPGGITK